MLHNVAPEVKAAAVDTILQQMQGIKISRGGLLKRAAEFLNLRMEFPNVPENKIIEDFQVAEEVCVSPDILTRAGRSLIRDILRNPTEYGLRPCTLG